MKLIVGLGNPGSKYAATRHNAGKLLVEFAAKQHCQNFSKKSALKSSLSPAIDWENQSVRLAYPEDFMNVSGVSVGLLCRDLYIDPVKDLLVVVDDIALPYGKLRLRGDGSSGGHNGLKSVESALGSSQYSRLRIGVGAPNISQPLEEYVLSAFSREEMADWPEFLRRGLAALVLWLGRPIEEAMNVINA